MGKICSLLNLSTVSTSDSQSSIAPFTCTRWPIREGVYMGVCRTLKGLNMGLLWIILKVSKVGSMAVMKRVCRSLNRVK